MRARARVIPSCRVSGVVQEFEEELAELHRRCEGRLDEEMIRLWLISLEREQIVKVGYRDDRIGERIATLHASTEFAEVVRHALVWAWRDEEMHAIYVRGTLLKLRRPWLSLRAYAYHVTGAIAGWVTSVRMSRDRGVSIAWIVASLIAWIGALMGKVSRVVAPHLVHQTFRGFCLFNVDAEETAAMAWGRLAELGDARGEPSARIEEYRRIEEDERRHAMVFAALADAFDEDDRVAPGVRVDDLVARIAKAGESYVARAQRAGRRGDDALGSGGVVCCAKGGERDDKREVLRRCVREAGLDALVASRMRATGKRAAELSVVIKPSFMLGYHRKDASTVTDPELVEALALHLRALGVTDVAILEGRNLYDFHYRNRRVADVAQYFGYGSDAYRIVDASDDQAPYSFDRGIALYSVSKTWRDADVRITFGKLRTHPVELVYLALANLEGIGARCDEFLFSDRQAHRDAALMTTANAFVPHFALIDAYDSAADGLVGVMACSRPRRPRRLYAGLDTIAVDVACASHVGVRNPRSASLLRTAFDWFGDPRSALRVVGEDAPIANWSGARDGDFRTFLGSIAYPVYEWGSLRGSLIVPEFDLEAFPPITPPGAFVRAVRAITRFIVGIRRPQ